MFVLIKSLINDYWLIIILIYYRSFSHFYLSMLEMAKCMYFLVNVWLLYVFLVLQFTITFGTSSKIAWVVNINFFLVSFLLLLSILSDHIRKKMKSKARGITFRSLKVGTMGGAGRGSRSANVLFLDIYFFIIIKVKVKEQGRPQDLARREGQEIFFYRFGNLHTLC